MAYFLAAELCFPDIIDGTAHRNHYLLFLETALDNLATNWIDKHTASNGESSEGKLPQNEYDLDYLTKYLGLAMPSTSL
jgi:hypothetical protein